MLKYLYWVSRFSVGIGHASNGVFLLTVWELSITIIFLWFSSSFTTNGCALYGDRLGSIIPSFNNRCVSESMNCCSGFENLRSLVAVGLQFADKSEGRH